MAQSPRARRRITWCMRIRRFIRFYHTPLRIRSSIVRLRHNHRRPYLALLSLFVPLPSWYFSVPEPAAPRVIAQSLSILSLRQSGIVNLQAIPVWRARDTPLRSLYRLYEIVMSGEYSFLRGETEYFWYQSRKKWALHLVPDPKDADPVRYAILACLVEELVIAFNWRLSLGMRRNRRNIYRERDEDPYPPFSPEELPLWTQFVPPIDPPMLHGLPEDMIDEGKLVLEKGGVNRTFAERNIVTNVGWFYTI